MSETTEWTPSPEDFSTKIKELEARINSLEASKASIAVLDRMIGSLELTVSNLQSQINVLDSKVALKPNKDEIIKAINLSEEGVRIKGDRIIIEKGETGLTVTPGVIKGRIKS